MITGAHVILYSTNAEADRAFFRDTLQFPAVDAGHGWLIFALPPAEIACHPDEKNGRHEFYLMCDDVAATVEMLSTKGIECEPLANQGWGMLTHLTLPGGGKLGLYQPRHPIAAGLRNAG
jgi:catechol 2,3-dioxygenase-like lactoylglutathione lyase family enzyme